MPDPLLKSNDGWGKQKEYAVGKVMLRRPGQAPPDAPREIVSDGLWRRFAVTAHATQRKRSRIAITELTPHGPR